MKTPPKADCPGTDELSALIDGELGSGRRDEIARHAQACPLCGTMLAEFTALSDEFRPLASLRPNRDLASSIHERLSAPGRKQAPAARGKPWRAWQLFPSGLAAALSLAAGVYLGALLAGGSAVAGMQPAMMAMFDAVPPGGICIGLQSCYGGGK